ncbi:Tetratricopeptide repeat protein 1 [Hypsizygus marmoreus]|uniref:Tetratricopeptide repeat protein 1 n=1 Tax=Hypsizygus marmoreus TaxID=39966 RepID=A0A369K352_HYPMA|nr:Tetratricopeptide repeat protein 1 [Hypsizygus marmoreus]
MADLSNHSQQAESISLNYEPPLDIAAALRDASVLKDEGNDYFRSSQWGQALVTYQSGLSQLPKRPVKPNHPSDGGDLLRDGATEEEADGDEFAKEHAVDAASDQDISVTQVELEQCAKVRAVLNANIAACHVKLGEHKQAVDACSQALLDDPSYVKALQRRAASNICINSWSSLTSAQEDYTTLQKILPPSSPLLRETERSLQSLKPRLENAQKQETAEMLGKLKGLGNSILGNFGLSTDNFKFEPNGQGGYSMNFSR